MDFFSELINQSIIQTKFPRKYTTPEYNLNDFILYQIGKGAYGIVYKAVHKLTGKKYAIKQILKQGHE
jgi:hypothetical protein